VSNRLQQWFPPGLEYVCVTIYPSNVLSRSRRQRFFKRYRALLHARYFPLVIHRINHWKHGLPNWHLTLTTTRPISRRFHKRCVTQALSGVGVLEPSRKRVGFFRETNVHAWLNYCLRTAERFELLPWSEMPPLGFGRREMTRLPSRVDRDLLSMMAYALSVTSNRVSEIDPERSPILRTTPGSS
jgi:hypothetical protein